MDKQTQPAPFQEWFKFHPANEDTGPVHDSIREGMLQTAEWLDRVLPNSPEKTLALRKLQESMMFANATIALYGVKPD